MPRFTELETYDVRFPTSLDLDGSDAMNTDPDYSAAYLILRTDAGDGLEGHGFAFTIGRGNDVQTAAIEALRDHVIGLDVDATLNDLGGFWKSLVHDSQLRWLGPEKGVMHMAIGAVVNAVWDLAAKRAGVPLWKLLSDLTPEQIVDLVDFRYLTDALTPSRGTGDPARGDGGSRRAGGAAARARLPGVHDDARLARVRRRQAGPAVPRGRRRRVHPDQAQGRREPGRRHPADAAGPRGGRPGHPDRHRRQPALGRGRRDPWVEALAPYDVWWVEEPTSPDDILGHAAIARAIAPIRVATGEHVQNRVVFKQMLQAGSLSVLQLDSARVAGVNENIAILLLAAKFGVPVCPHAGGVGLCELVQHLSMFDYVAVSGSAEDRVIEYVDHLHEHFLDPVVIRDGHYVAPVRPGFGAEMNAETLTDFRYPSGKIWIDLTDSKESGK